MQVEKQGGILKHTVIDIFTEDDDDDDDDED
jgi:hypothetical protein